MSASRSTSRSSKPDRVIRIGNTALCFHHTLEDKKWLGYLISGATGFVGSSLAAKFLSGNAYVVAISRNDPTGARTFDAVKQASKGNGIEIDAALAARFEAINIDFTNLDADLARLPLADITEVWHIAAEMTYSGHKLPQSFSANVGNTALLYQSVLKYAPNCRRFYYVSTAYVAGMTGGLVHEQIHPSSELVNTYQVTKWGAEHALHFLYHRHGLPVTVLRPTIVVGNRRTYWAQRNGFGFYMFLEAMSAVARAGHKELNINLVGSARPDLVCIDQLAEDATALVLRDAAPDSFEVFHCSGGLQSSTSEIVKMWGEVTGVRAAIGAPVTAVEQQFDRAVERNRQFGSTEWTFERDKLDAAISRREPPVPLSLAELHRICEWYVGKSATPARPALAEVN
jgi:nucleoside-diphosphate-sugar epimerase